MSPEGKLTGSFLVLFFIVYVTQNQDPFETCSRYTSFGYGYRDFFEFREGNFSPNQIFYLEFHVKTSSDAHILLKPEVSDDKGYEIVVGGGSNTFSQIRFLETKKTMITEKTEGLLSAEEYRHFWISIDKLGIISVGRKEGDEVFMNWRFDNPFPIRFFSFGSWTNVKADWRFACKPGADSGIIHKEEAMTPLKKLKRDLFTLYDPNALPVDKKTTLEVKVNFQINNVQLDEKRGELTLYGSGDLKWTDGKIKWKPENYEGIENVLVPPYLIWTPSIRVLNALALDRSPLFDLSATGVMARYDGSIFWRPPFKSVSHCEIDLRLWPFDVHNCSVLFGFWMEPPNLLLSMMDEYDAISEDRTESDWKILRAIPFNTHHPDEDENYGILYIELKRANGSQGMIISVPYAAAVLLTLVSFWVPLNSSLKLHLMFGSIVLQLLVLFLAGQLVPAMTKGVPRIVNLYSWTVIVTCVPVVLYVVLKNIQSSVHVPKILDKILNNSVFAKVFCLPNMNEVSMEYSNLNDEVNKRNRDYLNSLRLVRVIERFFFLGFLIAIILLCLLL